ncbi:hypothetical protein [Dysgonomonas sp. 520]|uniref:hypothetical protein n=1 Tax=Dysgonomonas sp. 520 TaxID=2302931 RepID=UPI0013D643FD|nr:hypothetical protein [Dysgonomonas sp. 520]NDW10696.1 hypothetical protein [Dysgonomonas sp. 520]
MDINKIKELIQQTEKSKIYKSQIITDYYNEVFGTSEKNTNCGSCLRVKVLKLKNYVKEQEVKIEIENPVTLEQVREEITNINDALRNEIIEPDSEDTKLSNDRLVDVIEQKTVKKKSKKNKE